MRLSASSLLITLIVGLSLLGCATGGRQCAEEALRLGAYYEAEQGFRDLYRKTPRKQTSQRAFYAQQAGKAALLGRRATTARQLLQSSLRLRPQDSLTAQLLHSVDSLLGQVTQPTPLTDSTSYQVRPFAPLRSSRSDYGVTFTADGREIFYTSHRSPREGKKTLSPVTGEAPAKLYHLGRRPDGAWSTHPDTLRGLALLESELGTPTLSPDGRTLYYTAITMLSTGEQVPQIYRSERTPEGSWTAGQVLPLFSDSTHFAAHPSLSPSGQRLFFVSPRLDSAKGKDLFVSLRQDKGWSQPLPLPSPINSSSDELFPYAYSDSLLYFASDRPGGQGGLDLYEAHLRADGTYHVAPLPVPLNSSGDEYGFYPSPSPSTWSPGEELVEAGLLASSREDTAGRPHLYEFRRHAIQTTIEVEILDREGYPISGALVRLVGKTTERAEQVASTDSQGRAKLSASPAVEYVMLASASDYLNQYVRLTTDESQQSETYSVTFYLASRIQVEQLREVYYAFDRTELLPESEPALEKLLQLLHDNPQTCIELLAHADRHGSAGYNQRLSERRAQSVVHYLTERGISPERLVARGYGKERPFVVTRGTAAHYPFLPEGATLTETFLLALPTDEERAIGDGLNRRTEFRVLE